MKIKKSDVGRYCRIIWEDVGAEDGILIEINTEYKNYKVFTSRSGIVCVDRDMISELGIYAYMQSSGLTGCK
jgi:hypothetical protein